MKKYLFILGLIVCLLVNPSFSQQKFRIVNDRSRIEYLEKKPASALTVIRMITVKIEYWADKTPGKDDRSIDLTVAAAQNATGSKPEISMTPTVIPAANFKTKHDTLQIDVPVTVHAIAEYSPEFFTIGIKGLDAADGGIMGVDIQKEGPAAVSPPTPQGFTLLNAVNLDFDGFGGASYVGQLNIFIPDVIRKKARHKIGMNLGIMKINYSRNDSLNKSYDYFENALIRPLDPIKTGTKYLRQYNQLSTVSKNLTWSFYFQPTYSLVYQPDFKLLLHIHTELFIDKWITNTTIRNYQQDSAVITAENYSLLKDSIALLNKFSKSTADPVSSSSTATTLNFTLGIGFTMEVNLWDGASLFVQPTIGWAFNYARPLSVSGKNLMYNPTKKENIHAHLTRFTLKQKLAGNLQGVIGIDVRGRFGRDPTYAAYVGANIGLDGIKKMLN